MNNPKQQVLSAQVVLRAASGKRLDGSTAITAANVQEYTPSPATVAHVKAALRAAGLNPGEVVGNSLSITAPTEVFERIFGVPVEAHARGGVGFARGGERQNVSYELTPDRLPPSLASSVEAITFTPPPDFGPTNFS